MAARSGDALYRAFSNQCDREVVSTVRLDTERLGIGKDTGCKVRLLSPEGSCGDVQDGAFEVTVGPNSLTAVKIEGVRPKIAVQQRLLAVPEAWSKDYAASGDDRVRCMVLNTGAGDCHAYVYFNISDTEYASATAEVNGKRLSSTTYPYEFTFPADAARLEIRTSARKKDGSVTEWETLTLEK